MVDGPVGNGGSGAAPLGREMPGGGEVCRAPGAAKLGEMGLPPDRPISDPLLRPDSGPRDASGAPVRAPLGNSIRTFLVFGVLIALGVGVWWLRRPEQLATSIGGREWVIVDVDGEAATNAAGVASTFVLDGNGEIRAPVGCNVATGSWAYDPGRSQLEISWETQTQALCPSDWPQTHTPDRGVIAVDDAVMQIETDTGGLRAAALADREPMALDEVAGSYVSGDHIVEIGRRGRFDVDGCSGSWTRAADEIGMLVEFDALQRDDCSLATVWRDASVFVPVDVGDVVFLWRAIPVFPLDRSIVRLDPVS